MRPSVEVWWVESPLITQVDPWFANWDSLPSQLPIKVHEEPVESGFHHVGIGAGKSSVSVSSLSLCFSDM